MSARRFSRRISGGARFSLAARRDLVLAPARESKYSPFARFTLCVALRVSGARSRRQKNSRTYSERPVYFHVCKPRHWEAPARAPVSRPRSFMRSPSAARPVHVPAVHMAVRRKFN